MNLEFDCTQFLASFELPINKNYLPQEKIFVPSLVSNSTISQTSVIDLPQMQNIFSLEMEEIKEDNHIWFDQQQYLSLDKPKEMSRKITVDDEQMCNQDISLKEQKKQQKRSLRALKNQTKNIPKNFGKAILAFIEKNKQMAKKTLEKYGEGTYNDLIDFLSNYKTKITTIADLRTIWINNQFQKSIRTLSCLFLRKFSLDYIYNSRVCNHGSHIKYRQRFLQALRSPDQFKHIKEY